MKLTVIGGGGVRSLFLARSIASRAKRLGISELVFMDNDPQKLRIYGTLAKETAKRIDPDLHFVLTENAESAIRDADYVITTIRVGGDEMRVRDERVALSHGVLGQETTGAAGLSFAMRSVSALREYCEWPARRFAIWAMISPTASATRRQGCSEALKSCTVRPRAVRQVRSTG